MHISTKRHENLYYFSLFNIYRARDKFKTGKGSFKICCYLFIFLKKSNRWSRLSESRLIYIGLCCLLLDNRKEIKNQQILLSYEQVIEVQTK